MRRLPFCKDPATELSRKSSLAKLGTAAFGCTRQARRARHWPALLFCTLYTTKATGKQVHHNKSKSAQAIGYARRSQWPLKGLMTRALSHAAWRGSTVMAL